MTLNDLECAIHLKVRLVDSTLDVRLLRVSDSTIYIGVARGEGGVGLRPGGPSPLLCGQLTRCFPAVAEFLVSITTQDPIALMLCLYFVFTHPLYANVSKYGEKGEKGTGEERERGGK